MGTKHTPGPWMVREALKETHAFTICSESARMEPIADVLHMGRAGSADARLIASSPDLLAAAEYAEELIKARVVQGARERIALAKLRAAIAKATGESAQ